MGTNQIIYAERRRNERLVDNKVRYKVLDIISDCGEGEEMKLDPLDTLFSQYVKLKAGGKCEYCGKTPSPQGYHNHHGVVGRRYLNTRWEEDNCAALCMACHNFLADFPSINSDFFIGRIGTKRMEEIEIMARTYRKMTKERREEIKQKLKEKIESLL